MNPSSILKFWFTELNPSQWWAKDEQLDHEIHTRFSQIHQQASQGELFTWRASPEGRLAEIIILDQFSRNLFRDQPQAFAYDGMALVLAQEAIASGADHSLPPRERSFLYLPFMHSESLKIHEIALKLFQQEGMEQNLDFERQHQAIIEKFGRYPHRNEILNRPSTPAEIEFLKQPHSRF